MKDLFSKIASKQNEEQQKSVHHPYFNISIPYQCMILKHEKEN